MPLIDREVKISDKGTVRQTHLRPEARRSLVAKIMIDNNFGILFIDSGNHISRIFVRQNLAAKSGYIVLTGDVVSPWSSGLQIKRFLWKPGSPPVKL